jgi:hypothetical protein
MLLLHAHLLHPLFVLRIIHMVQYSTLVLTSRRLTSLKLVKIPPTNRQTTLVVIHALAEALDVICARTGLRHLSGRGVGGLVLCAELGGLGGGFGGGGGAATEPAADCVAYGGAYCDTAGSMLASDL